MNFDKSTIKVFDNFLDKDEEKSVLEYVSKSSFIWGEIDDKGLPTTGMCHDIPEEQNIYRLFDIKVRESYRPIRKSHLYRMVINCFAPREIPYFHIDGDTGMTFIYYIGSSSLDLIPSSGDKWEYNDGGETQIIVNDEIKGILPLPNRLVGFDANLIHRATPFRDKHRFTLAVKFN